jgi:hypothetical protein
VLNQLRGSFARRQTGDGQSAVFGAQDDKNIFLEKKKGKSLSNEILRWV